MEFPPFPDDLVTCLAKAAAAFDRPPRIVSIGRAPASRLMAQVFGPEATSNLVVRAGADGMAEFTSPDGAPASPLDLKPANHALLPRFMDPESFDLTAARHRGWLARGAGVIVHFPPARAQIARLAEAGYREESRFTEGRETTVFTRPPRRAPAPAGTGADARPSMRRLVIVDPCLGGAPGHYVPYARALSEAALARGARVVWGCHARLDPSDAPPGVEVRRCFDRSFFDLEPEELAAVDLSPELAVGWAALAGEFDGEGAHFLAHNVDSHLPRAMAARLSDFPARSAVHLGFHTAPRRMPGRAAGEEAHRVIMRLRSAPQWERSLFFWAENRRLGRWLGQWLRAPVLALPLVPPSGPGGPVAARGPGAPLTVSVLGESRPTKGFYDLPDLADALAASPSLSGSLKLVIQDWPTARTQPEKHRQAVARLARHPFVELVGGRLAPADYDRRLAATDVLLLPYDPEIYNLRGSGILAEGFARGVMVVTRAGAAMEEEAGEGMVLTYETPSGLAEALQRLLGRLDAARDQARVMGAAFRAAHTPERFLAALDARAGGAA